MYQKTKIELISEIESPRLKIELTSNEILIIYGFFGVVYIHNVIISQLLQRVSLANVFYKLFVQTKTYATCKWRSVKNLISLCFIYLAGDPTLIV